MLKYPKAVPSKTATGRAILSLVLSAICVGESPVQLQSGVRFQPHFKLHFEGSSEQQLFLSYSLRTQLKPLRQELVCGLIAERPVNAGRLRPSSETAEVGTGSHLSANVTTRQWLMVLANPAVGLRLSRIAAKECVGSTPMSTT